MTQHQKNFLARKLNNLSRYYRQPIDQDSLNIFIEAVEDLELSKILLILDDWIKTSKKNCLPTVADIREKYKPTLNSDLSSRILLSHIVFAIGRFGSYYPNEAKEYLGAFTWNLIFMTGGWNSLCRTRNLDNQTNIDAQLRELIKSKLEAEDLVLEISVKDAYKFLLNDDSGALEFKDIIDYENLAELTTGDSRANDDGWGVL